MDIELAIDVLEMSDHLDHVILFSGDGDFRRLVEAVQRKGLHVSVVSTIKSSPPMVADELRRQADDLIDLAELAPLIARPAERADGLNNGHDHIGGASSGAITHAAKSLTQSERRRSDPA